MDWKSPVSDQAAARRAGGRRRYNALRKKQAKQRRRKLACLIRKCDFQIGWQRRFAGILKVSESTISRDLMTPNLQREIEKRFSRLNDEEERRFLKGLWKPH